MANIRLLISSFFLAIVCQVNGQNEALNTTSTTPIIEVLVLGNNHSFLGHTVENNQTLFSICKYYDVSISDVMLINALDSQDAISPGVELLLPMNKNHFYVNTNESNTLIPLIYKAKAKETLFTIAKVYFNQDVDHLCARNGIIDYKLALDQKLVIGYYDITAKKKNQYEQSEYVIVKKDVLDLDTKDEEKQKETQKAPSNSQITRIGIAFWDKRKKSSSMLVLHKEAKPNTMIKIKNTLTGMSVFAKVAGKIPDNLYRQDIDCVISPEVAKKIGALDSKFQVLMTYEKGSE